MDKAYFGAGCFWGVEETFRTTKGVVATAVGYQGGTTKNPTYKEVCSGTTNHAEVVEVTFDPEVITYKELLEVFWSCHNPTLLNRQGPDVGTQYRSVIFTVNQEQAQQAQESKRNLEQLERFNAPIVTEIKEMQPFYKAEEYHQQYFLKNGGGSCKLF